MPRRAKQPETPPPEDLTDEDRLALSTWILRKRKEGMFLWFEEWGQVRREVEKCLAWHRERDKWRRNWMAAVQNWLVKADEFHERDAKAGVSPHRVNLDAVPLQVLSGGKDG